MKDKAQATFTASTNPTAERQNQIAYRCLFVMILMLFYRKYVPFPNHGPDRSMRNQSPGPRDLISIWNAPIPCAVSIIGLDIFFR